MIPINCNAVGDIIALATLVIDVAQALNDAGGSTFEYRSFIDELNALHAMLTSAARIADDSVDNGLRDQIIRTADQCGHDIQQALTRIAKFSTLDLDGAAANGLRLKLKRNWYKVEWRFMQRDEAQTFRKELAMVTQRLTTLLVISDADGAVRFRKGLLREVNASVARDATLLRAINGNAAILNKLDAAPRRGHALVQELSDNVPDGVDSKTAAIAVLCAAVCAMHAPYDRTVPTALLMIAIYILSQSSGQYGRALVHDVAYSSVNAVTLLDALGRCLILPSELCETRDMFHATLVTLFSQMRGRWLIDSHRYSIRSPQRQGGFHYFDGWPDWERVRPGTCLEMSVVISQRGVSCCPRCGRQQGPCAGQACGRCGVRVTSSVRARSLADGGGRSDFGTQLEASADDRGIFPGSRPNRLSDAKSMSFRFDGSSALRAASSGNTGLLDENNRPKVPLDWFAQVQEFSRIELCDSVIGPHGDLDINDYYNVPVQYHRGFLAAVDNGHYALVVTLLDEGVDVNARSESGLTALHVASLNGYSSIVELLLDHGATIDASTEDNYTPLALAVMSSRVDTTSLLIARGAIVDAPRHIRAVVLYVAAGCGNIGVTQVVLRYGTDVNMHLSTQSNQTALHAAVLSRSNPTIELLVRNGADVTARSERGNTPLSLAAREGNVHAFELFLSQTSIEYLQLSESQQPWPSNLLFDAMQGRSLKILDTLVQTGLSDVNIRFQDGATPLSLASERGQHALVEFLLAKGADRDADALPSQWPYPANRLGSWKALHAAAYSGHANIIEILLQHGADVNARTLNGDTPVSVVLERKLYFLREMGWNDESMDEVLETLLSRGAVTDERSSLLLEEIACLVGSLSSTVVPGAWCEDVE